MRWKSGPPTLSLFWRTVATWLVWTWKRWIQKKSAEQFPWYAYRALSFLLSTAITVSLQGEFTLVKAIFILTRTAWSYALRGGMNGNYLKSPNTLRPIHNGRHIADNIYKSIFLNENIWISIKISQNFVPKSRFYNIPALVQIMAWRRRGDKPLSEQMMVSLPTYICVTRPQWANLRLSNLLFSIVLGLTIRELYIFNNTASALLFTHLNSLAPGGYGNNFKSMLFKHFIQNSIWITHYEIAPR